MPTSNTLSTLAMVFPGQGSQSIGMLSALADAFPQVGETFASASSVLGYNLWERVQNGPAEALNQTACTQPAMLAAGVATWRCWQAKTDIVPALMAGHSLGEYTALVCSGAIEFTDAIALVEKRGEFMQAAVPEGIGAMAAILGLEDEQVEAVCKEASQGEVVSAVNFNSPGQVVIAGNSAAVERAMRLAKTAGAKRALPLPVSVPSHCSLMESAAKQLAEQLAGLSIQVPSIPVIHNVDALPHNNVVDICAALTAQLHRPVRWVECVRTMHTQGVNTLVEAGPGKVLAGLTRRIEKTLSGVPVQSVDNLNKAIDLVN
ncbi:Malonyl CoA-acyl carrier protein transacylase [hydrothermal vent metagenome]|uniref:[acyl-carrier-protein] S-malonyltransferase n=1 Tax=hydrothermal vent metagenome TaxID=652676 RepID=A0A3B0YW09_9ZZZZ